MEVWGSAMQWPYWPMLTLLSSSMVSYMAFHFEDIIVKSKGKWMSSTISQITTTAVD